MAVHTVIIRPFIHSSHCEHITTACGGCQGLFSTNLQPRHAYQVFTHHSGESRKKGSDDPYGNGQGRIIRQDHA